ncbi:MAG: cobalamin-dependent protein [Deltaproteobacteria bacterium]|nr:cobalamin-dependent protein [Deltaproteobacteria bacterium]
MKIVLVQPPWVQVPGRFGETPPDAPMGHAYLAAYARERFGDAVSLRILDAVAEGLSEEGTRRAIVTEKPAIVGYTNVTATAPVVKRLALGVRDAVPDIVQIAGGPHASVVPGDMIGPLDLAVRGEGEHTFAEIVERRLAGTNDWSGIAGTSYLRGGEPFDEPSRPYVKNLDELPFPARDLLPMHAYSHEYPTRARNRRFVTFFTARGCPWDCSFCCKHQVWGRYARFRTLDNVFAELEFLRAGYDPGFVFLRRYLYRQPQARHGILRAPSRRRFRFSVGVPDARGLPGRRPRTHHERRGVPRIATRRGIRQRRCVGSDPQEDDS